MNNKDDVIHLLKTLPPARAERFIKRIQDEAERSKRFKQLEADRKANGIAIELLTQKAGYDRSNYNHYIKGRFVPMHETLDNYQIALGMLQEIS